MKSDPVSYHGGHSGQFCTHAADRLESIICRYIDLGFKAVGITEHIPPVSARFVYPDELAAGQTAEYLFERFVLYFKELSRLKGKYSKTIQIYAGMETETVTGYKNHVQELITRFRPDYIVGSVHHVNDICFDYSRQEYEKALLSCGSINQLYCRYFDQQYDMIKTLKPFVVGHFDLIRIFDPGYADRLSTPEISEKIDRNLELIKSLNLVMDFNLRPLSRGEKEPYISPVILERAKKMELQLVPGDDSHGVNEAGKFVNKAINILKSYQFNLKWPKPKIISQ